MTSESLEDRIAAAGNPVTLLRNASGRPDPGPLTGAEMSNWRDEQSSWRQTVGLFDLSHHMTDLTLRGPDAVKLVSDLGVNSLANFEVGKAKQLVSVNEDGHVIGDAIVDYFAPDDINLASTPVVSNWFQFHVETGDYDVTWSRDEPTARNPLGHPQRYRFQVNGPLAMEVLEKAIGGPVPDIAFFNAGMLDFRGTRVRALSHNMSRAKGVELQGPWADAARVREILFEAGQEFGLTPIGSRAPTPAAIESGWVAAPLPAVYTGDSLKAYRQWLPANGFEGAGSLGGSLASDDISDYYLTPADLGYAKLVKFDHDFVGREALERMAAAPAPRRKVTLLWDKADVLRVLASGFDEGTPFKAIDLPLAAYATWQYDAVKVGDRDAGVSLLSGYSYNERKMMSLAVVDAGVAEGAEVTVVWGEEDGGTGKPQVERHVQTGIRAVVAPVPYGDVHFR